MLAQFRRAGHRAAGKQRPQALADCRAGPQATRDGADQLMHGLIRFHFHQPRDVDAADFADARQIVPDEIDDHQIFRAVAGIAGQQIAQLRVFFRIASAADCPFDGTRLGVALPIDTQEAFRARSTPREIPSSWRNAEYGAGFVRRSVS